MVKPSGARTWVLRMQKDGRRRDYGLGSALDVSLAEARDAAYEEIAKIQSWANAHITSCGLIADVSLPEKGLLDLQATGVELPDWMDGHEFEAAYAYLRFFGQIWDQIPVNELVRVAELPGRLDRDALAAAAGLSPEEARELTRTIVVDAARRPSHLRH